MSLWMLERRPIFKTFEKCLCQRNCFYSKLAVIFPTFNKLTFYMNETGKICKLSTPSTTLLQSQSLALSTSSSQNFSSSTENQQIPESPKVTNKNRLKRAVKDYGATVIVFHVTISLISLGLSYLAVSSGVDVASLLDKLGLDAKNQLTTGASTFVVAYAFHKVFAPVRISITLGSTPFIVRYLRQVGILKPPKTSGP